VILSSASPPTVAVVGEFRKGDRLANNKGRRFLAELLTQGEVRALLGACSSRAPPGIRNRALMAVLYRGGLRVSEALALGPRDVDAGSRGRSTCATARAIASAWWASTPGLWAGGALD